MQVEQLAPGLWRWKTAHPDWTPAQGGPEGWDPDVGSVYAEAYGDVLLIDPLVPADEAHNTRFWAALDRDVARAGTPHVLITCAWHARSSAAVLARYPGARLRAPADALDDLPAGVQADPFSPGDPLPGRAAAIDATIPSEVLFWLPSHNALVAGDTLLGDEAGGVRLCPDSWLGGKDSRDVRAALWSQLADLPIERILVAHGNPVTAGGGVALQRALVAA